MIGDGIGSGLVVDGDVVHGAHGMAGEIGHTMYVPDGRPCRCGNFGCVEAYASVPAIWRGPPKTAPRRPPPSRR